MRINDRFVWLGGMATVPDKSSLGSQSIWGHCRPARGKSSERSSARPICRPRLPLLFTPTSSRGTHSETVTVQPIQAGSLVLQTASLAAPTTKSPHIRRCTANRAGTGQADEGGTSCCQGSYSARASIIKGPRPGRRAAWHKARAASRHEHCGIERGDAGPERCLVWRCVARFCHGSLHLDTPSVTGGKVTSRVATRPVAPAT
jgi:hypothetical protein